MSALRRQMVMILFSVSALMAGGVCAQAPDASGDVASVESTQAMVVRVRAKPVFYEQQGDSFRRMTVQPDVNVEGMLVVKTSSRGYVLLKRGHESWWVDRSRVVIEGGDQAALPKARCQELSSISADALQAGVRGAGEGCRR